MRRVPFRRRVRIPGILRLRQVAVWRYSWGLRRGVSYVLINLVIWSWVVFEKLRCVCVCVCISDAGGLRF